MLLRALPFLFLLSAPGVLFAQQGWVALDRPSRISDAHLNSQGSVAILGGGKTHVSFDSGRSWISNPISGSTLNSIILYDNGRLVALGGNPVDPDHFLWQRYWMTSDDTGSTWLKGTGETGNGALSVFCRTGKLWFEGLVYPYNKYSGASKVYVQNESRPIYASAEPMSSVDIIDSIAMGVVLWSPTRLLRTTNRGNSWTTVFTIQIVGSNYRDPGTIRRISHSTWLLSANDKLHLSTDTGNSWASIYDCTGTVSDIQVGESSIYLSYTGEDYILVSRDTGKTWRAQSLPYGRTVDNLLMVSDSFLYGYSQGSLVRTVDAGGPPAAVLHCPRAPDYGSLPFGAVQTRSLVLKNIGDAPLIIDSVLGGDSVTVVSIEDSVLNPGDSTYLRLSFTPLHSSTQTQSIRLVTNTLPIIELIEIRYAASRPQLELQDSVVVFGDVLEGDFQRRRVRIKNIGKASAYLTIDTPNTISFSVYSIPDTLKANESGEIIFEYRPTEEDELSLVTIEYNNFWTQRFTLSGNRVDSNALRYRQLPNLTTFPFAGLASQVKQALEGVWLVTHEYSDSSKVQLWASVCSTSGSVRRSQPIGEASPNFLLTRAASDTLQGLAIVWPQEDRLAISRVTPSGQTFDSVIPRQKSRILTDFPVTLALTSNGSVAVGWTEAHSVSGTQGDFFGSYDPAIAFLKIYNFASGQSFLSEFNGTASFNGNHPPNSIRGDFDCMIGLTASGTGFLYSMTGDRGGYQHQYWNDWENFDHRLHSIRGGHGVAHAPTSTDRVYTQGGPVAADDDLVIWTYRTRNKDYIIWAENEGIRVWMDSIVSSTMDSAHRIVLTRDRVYLVGESSDPIAKRQIVILTYSRTGEKLGTAVGDGPYSDNDRLVAASVNDSLLFVLVRSQGVTEQYYFYSLGLDAGRVLRQLIDPEALGFVDLRLFDIASDTTGVYLAGSSLASDSVWRPVLLKYGSVSLSVRLKGERLTTRLYPNPVRNAIRIAPSSSMQMPLRARITDVLGIIWGDIMLGSVDAVISCEGLPAGVYHLMLEDQRGNVERASFVKQ